MEFRNYYSLVAFASAVLGNCDNVLSSRTFLPDIEVLIQVFVFFQTDYSDIGLFDMQLV